MTHSLTHFSVCDNLKARDASASNYSCQINHTYAETEETEETVEAVVTVDTAEAVLLMI